MTAPRVLTSTVIKATTALPMVLTELACAEHGPRCDRLRRLHRARALVTELRDAIDDAALVVARGPNQRKAANG
jgi:hypothetical protein